MGDFPFLFHNYAEKMGIITAKNWTKKRILVIL